MQKMQIAIPGLVKIKEGALVRLGVYLRHYGLQRIALLASGDLKQEILDSLDLTLQRKDIVVEKRVGVEKAAIEEAQAVFTSLPNTVGAVVGFGGGKALDVAKYVAFLARLPYIAVPTSLSNDGFCSPQCSLTVAGRRRSLPAAMPFGVVVDTEICLQAPLPLWLSGVGDLTAKFTAVVDWKLAARVAGVEVNDFAALLSDATVFQFMARPERDAAGVKLLGTALMLNGIAMEICGSSRPASGSEHLISHALDATSKRPRLHGLQVGMATYLVSQLQKVPMNRKAIAQLLDQTDFWSAIKVDPFDRAEWLKAVEVAPTVKKDFYTVLSSGDAVDKIARIIDTDPRLDGCFR